MPSPRAAKSKPGMPTKTASRTPSAPAAPPTRQQSPPQTQRAAPTPPNKPTPPRRKIVTQEQRDEAMNLPLVKQVVDLFDARLVDLQDEAPPVTPTDEATSDTTEEDDDV